MAQLVLCLHAVTAFSAPLPTSTSSIPPARNLGILERPIDQFCRGTNDAFRRTVFPSIREKVDIREAGHDGAARTYLQKALSTPELPGISRPTSLVILASVPTALVWYGFYKFSVEEELYHDELARHGALWEVDDQLQHDGDGVAHEELRLAPVVAA